MQDAITAAQDAAPQVAGDQDMAPAVRDRLVVRNAPPAEHAYRPPHETPVKPQPTPEEIERLNNLQMEKEAIAAPTAIQGGGGAHSQPAAPVLPAGLHSSMPGIPVTPAITSIKPPAGEGDSTDAKLAFLEEARSRERESYLKAIRTEQLTPFTIRAGWEIPAVLEQALNSDLPGEIKARVKEHVYDTATGRYLLIPQGSLLVGAYDSRVSYGQSRIQIIWNRVIFPDASSLDLDGMMGLDKRGQAGATHDVDNHYKRLWGMAALSSAFGAVFAATQRQNQSTFVYPSPGEMAGQSVARELAMTGQQITRKNLNVAPTVKVPLGYEFTVRVNKDILFESPYQPAEVPGPARLPVARMPIGADAQ